MKTPHRITLIRGDTTERYNPVTDTYETGSVSKEVVPCFVNRVTNAKVFEDYGSRTDEVIAIRFMTAPKPFSKAEFNDKTYEPLEEIDAPIKGAVRLRKVGKT